jgi:hypothetical protein
VLSNANSSVGLLSPSSSIAIATPPSSHNSPSLADASRLSTQNSLPRWITATLPFYYPETCFDRRRFFSGREHELAQIHGHLLEDGTNPAGPEALRLVSISGLGGMGKTELAYQYALQHRSDYDVILIIKADSMQRLKEQYSKLCIKLGLLFEQDKPSDEECREALKAWFKRPQQMQSSSMLGGIAPQQLDQNHTRWLLVFDNVKQWATVDPYWPDQGRGCVVLTSRTPDLRPQFASSASAKSLDLKELPSLKSAHLLKHYAGHDGEQAPEVEKAAQDLATRLDGMPLAVMQVGSYIKQCHMTITRFCESHPKESDLYTVYLVDDPVQGYEHNLASVWTLEALSRPAFMILSVLALLDPEGVPEALLQPDAQGTELGDFPSDEPEYHQICRVLINASLIERTTESRITIHRMVQKVLQAKATKEAELPGQLFRHNLQRIMSRWPYISRNYKFGTQGEIDRWTRCEELLPHIMTMSRAYLDFRAKRCLPEASLELAELQYEAAL